MQVNINYELVEKGQIAVYEGESKEKVNIGRCIRTDEFNRYEWVKKRNNKENEENRL